MIKGIDLTGKTAIVTGGYSGIGLTTVRTLRDAGAQVIVPARNAEGARAALRELDGVRVEALDLVDPASVDAFAERFLAEGRPLHLLINNAGVMATPLTRDARGNELQFAVNHLGHFRLTTRLWPALAAAGGARVVALSSRGHRYLAGGVRGPELRAPRPTSRSWPTASPRPPTRCSPSSSTGAAGTRASAPSPCTPGRFSTRP